MKIIAFYGFKGGVGRSIALFNVAYLLAMKRGARVVLADWDIHAPGLTCLPELEDPQNPGPSQGVVEVLVDLVQPTEDNSVLDPGPLVHPTRVGERVRAATGGDANIWLLPAGRFDGRIDRGEYSAALNRISPRLSDLVRVGQKDVVDWFADRILEAFRARGERKPDYLFLDTRTGLTEVGELLLSPATDQVVIVFGLNRQNVSGMEHVLRRLSRPGDFGAANLPNRVVLVASPVPSGEEELKERKLREVREIARRVVEEAAGEQSPPGRVPIEPVVPVLLSLPYHPFLALSDELMVERFPASEPSRAYEQLAETVRIREPSEIDGNMARTLGSALNLPKDDRPRLEGVDYPLARPLPWNVVCPNASPSALVQHAGSAIEPVLTGLANSLKVSDKDRADILDSAISIAQWAQLATHFEVEQREWRMYSPAIWPAIAEKTGRSWIAWALMSARRLAIPSEQAIERLLHGWPYPFTGETGIRAAVAAVDALVAESKDFGHLARKWLERIEQANPKLPLAHGLVGDRLLRLFHNRPEADDCFSRASALPPDSTSAELGYNLLESAVNLPKNRREDARILLEQSCTHSERALVLQPDSYVAQANWGAALTNLAALSISTEPTRAQLLAEQAVLHLDRASAIKPELRVVEEGLGKAWMLQARALASSEPTRTHALFERGIHHIQRALMAHPDMAEIEAVMGLALTHQAIFLEATDLLRANDVLTAASHHFERAFGGNPKGSDIAEGYMASELRRAHVLKKLDRPEEATAAAERALAVARRAQQITGKVSYNLACALAQTGNRQEALQTLESLARENSLPPAKHMESDTDLSVLTGDPRFEAILATLRDQQPA